MAETQQQELGVVADPFVQLRDLEEKQRLLKERLLLLGQNLIETKEKNRYEITNIKKDIEVFRQELENLKELSQRIVETLDTKATKAEVEILQRQIQLNTALKNHGLA